MNTSHIRNFVIIAHIDHGKSTLADRFLELTHTVEDRKMKEQLLDTMDLERERGITIKMAPVQMIHKINSDLPAQAGEYELNLIDTPGHVDFSYEVSRALAAVEGAILLVDGTKGVQAQTLAHLNEAEKQGIAIIPVINKIDMPAVQVENVEKEIESLLPGKKIFKISGKEGTGVEELLEEVIKQIPPPKVKTQNYSRALIFDSQYDPYKGVLAYVRVMNGEIRGGDSLKFLAQKKKAESLEVGVFKPELTIREKITEGSMGYIATGIKETEIVRVGDTIVVPTEGGVEYEALVGYEEPKPVVFASVFPSDGTDIAALQDAFSKLKLSDWALTYETDSSQILGKGFRCGFLGSLHLDIILERFQREFNLNFVATTPSVSYEMTLNTGQEKNIYSPSEFPTADRIKEVREPWVQLAIFTPKEYLGGIMKLLQSRRGIYVRTDYLSSEKTEIFYEVPLSEIIVDFYDKLKSISSGFASLSYELIGWRASNLVKLIVLVAGDEAEALAKIVPRERAEEEGRRTVKKLKKLLPRQMFKVSLQAAIGGKIIAREDLAALKKDVTGHLYGGDITRKMKLREKQKKGKKKMKQIGRVAIPDRVFVDMLKTSGQD
jgi:GTP-binding protein LepA